MATGMRGAAKEGRVYRLLRQEALTLPGDVS
jgi:hypothetical protein